MHFSHARRATILRASLAALCVWAAAASALGQTQPSATAPALAAPAVTPPKACGLTLSDAVLSAWRDQGGESGRLGCATAVETPTSTSPVGSAARAAVFGQNGEIILHVSGPRAGQAYAVAGCFYRLYVQFGGSSGWLGLPVDEAINTPDGSRQAFEGGMMRYTRAYDDCEATPTPKTAPPPVTVTEATLDVFEDAATGDRLSLASPGTVAEASSAGYQRLRAQAKVLSEAAPGATRLKFYRNEARGLAETLATPQSERDALAAGFEFEAGQGYVWTEPRPGAVALKQFVDPLSGRTRLTAGAQDESDALARGYRFVRVEGYADPAP